MPPNIYLSDKLCINNVQVSVCVEEVEYGWSHCSWSLRYQDDALTVCCLTAQESTSYQILWTNRVDCRPMSIVILVLFCMLSH